MTRGLIKFESDVLNRILTLAGRQTNIVVSNVLVFSEEKTSKGMFLRFQKKSIHDDQVLSQLGKRVYCDVTGLEYGVGFVLYMEDNDLVSLEVFTHGPEEFPRGEFSYTLSEI